MRAIRNRNARDASVRASAVLTGETRHAIVGIIATGGRSKAPVDLEIAGIVGVAAIAIGRARATWGHETALQIIASGLVAFLACGAGLVVITEVFFVGAFEAERAGATARPCVEASVGAAVRASVQIDAGVAAIILDPGRSGITTANRRRNGQQHESKESHGQGAAGQPQR